MMQPPNSLEVPHHRMLEQLELIRAELDIKLLYIRLLASRDPDSILYMCEQLGQLYNGYCMVGFSSGCPHIIKPSWICVAELSHVDDYVHAQNFYSWKTRLQDSGGYVTDIVPLPREAFLEQEVADFVRSRTLTAVHINDSPDYIEHYS